MAKLDEKDAFIDHIAGEFEGEFELEGDSRAIKREIERLH